MIDVIFTQPVLKFNMRWSHLENENRGARDAGKGTDGTTVSSPCFSGDSASPQRRTTPPRECSIKDSPFLALLGHFLKLVLRWCFINHPSLQSLDLLFPPSAVYTVIQ